MERLRTVLVGAAIGLATAVVYDVLDISQLLGL